jgi:hypothetical protein
MQHAPAAVSCHDEEAQSRYLNETSSHKNDEHFIDGVSVEDWILKTQEQAERNCQANVSASLQNDGRSNGGTYRSRQPSHCRVFDAGGNTELVELRSTTSRSNVFM